MPGPPAPVRPLLAAGVLGWCAGLGQVVLLRELLVIAGGNELVLAMGLALWLGLSGLGSLAAGRWSQGGLSAPLVLAGAGPLAGLLLARLVPVWAGLTPGAVPGLAGLAGLGLMVLGPAGLAAGAAFPCLMAAWSPGGPSQAPGLARLYALEALGAALAGALFALVLAGHIPAPGLLALGGLLPALVAAMAAVGRLRWPAWAWAAALAVALVFCGPLDHALRQAQWPGWRVLGQAETPYAQLLAARRGGQVDFFAAGQWLFSLPDPEARQRAALTPLLAKPDAARILFLGGAASGSAALAARHAPRAAVTAVELDPWLEAFRQTQAPDPAPANLRLVFADPRRWLQAPAPAGGWDLIVVEQPPPDGLLANRYYSRTGFAALAAGLRPGGVAVLSLPGVGEMLGPLQSRQLGSIVAAGRESFGQVLLLPGPELRLACARAADTIPTAPEAWISRLAAIGGDSLTGLRPDLLQEILDPWRARQLQAALAQTGPHPANQDLRPRALLYDPQLWGAQLGRAGGLALGLGRISAWPLALALLALAGLGWALGGRGEKPGRGLLGWGLAVTGALSLALALCLMLGYQVSYGSVYLGLAPLMAAFMLGLAGAAWGMGRWPAALARGRRGLALVGLGLGLACLAAWALIAGLAGAGAAHPAWAAALLLLAGLDGGLTGAYFSLAGRLWAGPGAGDGRLAGAVYGLDLLGGVAGALWPLALAPSLGLGPALGLLALLGLGPALGLGRPLRPQGV
ncbi:MAG: hypothetical protein V1797_12025 [Pseudomonadota bacterium]